MNKDGRIITKKLNDDKFHISMIDYVIFQKKVRFLAKYFRKTYKHLIFDILPILKCKGDTEGSHIYKLPIISIFNKVYGDLELHYSVKDKEIILEDITPGDILIAGYMYLLPVYKGIPYRNNKDLAKIKLAIIMEGKQESEKSEI